MKKLKIYTYFGCGSCIKATKYLTAKGIDYDELPIRETPPSLAEIEQVFNSLGQRVKPLLNMSGQEYRRLGLKDTVGAMSDAAVFRLLSENGNLVKRPFVVTETGGWTGFKAEIWDTLL